MTKFPVLLIWDFYPGSWITDRNVSHPGSRILDQIFSILDPWSQIWMFPIPDPISRMHIKEFNYFNQKRFLSSRKYDPGFPSRIRITDLDPDYLPILDTNPGSQIPNPGIKNAPDPWSRIRIRNTGDFGFAQAVGGSVGYWLSTSAAVLRTNLIGQLSKAFMCKNKFSVYFI